MKRFCCATMDFSVFFEKGTYSPAPLQGNGFFVSGARSCGKTSFTFQAVINTILDGGSVLVLCSESSIYSKVPQPFVPLASLPEEALQRIEFIYINRWSEAVEELAMFDKVDEVPSLIVVDDDEFADAAEEGNTRSTANIGGVGVPLCLSYLENMKQWRQRNGKPFFYIAVSNTICVSEVHALPLPYAVFPLVRVWVGRRAWSV
ncbi:hypothetical protein AGDE_04056 [Angomonas deanei]|nr:hypothetical protein AGDE_08234 [Angomonas deanei]EPY39872.1 hypothetical protein AGDE_04056 [Angomonas deanei]|eukprot:EPY33537.1 hypothetical protein AGDE_08234 [Angomonas deanei]